MRKKCYQAVQVMKLPLLSFWSGHKCSKKMLQHAKDVKVDDARCTLSKPGTEVDAKVLCHQPW